MSETRNLLVWRWQTVEGLDRPMSAWVADGLAGRKYNIIIDKAGTEALIRLPGNKIFIGGLEDTVLPIDDVKAFLQADHDNCCTIRDLSAYLAHKQTAQAEVDRQAAATLDKPRIIIPGQG